MSGIRKDAVLFGGNQMNITKRCPFCGCHNTVTVDPQEYKNWQEGELAQRAFKRLNADEREILITGICNDCWPREDGLEAKT
jgi:hypothetical protein